MDQVTKGRSPSVTKGLRAIFTPEGTFVEVDLQSHAISNDPEPSFTKFPRPSHPDGLRNRLDRSLVPTGDDANGWERGRAL